MLQIRQAQSFPRNQSTPLRGGGLCKALVGWGCWPVAEVASHFRFRQGKQMERKQIRISPDCSLNQLAAAGVTVADPSARQAPDFVKGIFPLAAP